MSFNPSLPADRSPIVAAELRNQFNALQAQIAALQEQLSPLVPVLTRNASGQWSLVYAGPVQDYWQVWVRNDSNGSWFNFGEVRTNQFPLGDDAMTPGGTWWQAKICGEDGDNNQCTPFSNIVSFGAV